MLTHIQLNQELQRLLSDTPIADPYTVNGMQVVPSDPQQPVTKLAVVVTPTSAMLEQVVSAGCQAVLAHHGLLWGKGAQTIDLALARPLRQLLAYNISLHVWHLPIDAHPTFGNNILLAQQIGLSSTAQHDLATLGQWDRSFAELIEAGCQAVGRRIPTFSCENGNRHPQRIAVVTGSGGGRLPALHQAGVQVLVTGEINLNAWHTAQELGMGIVALGHNDTENAGVRALAAQLQHVYPDLEVEYFPEECPV